MAFRPKFSKSAPQQAEADRDALREAARSLTADQVIALGAAMQNGKVDLTNYLANIRADSTTGDGLKMVVRRDEADRAIREFQLQAGHTKRSAWMGKFMAEPQEQVQINRKCVPMDEFPKIEAKWRQDRAMREQAARDIAAGKPVHVDLSYSYADAPINV